MVKQLNSVAVLKNDFISSFTHEFNTPVSSIKGFAELLDGAENLTKEQKEYVKIIIEESKSLSMLAENTMKLARLDSQTIITEKKEFSLDGQLQECVLLFDNILKEKNYANPIVITPGYPGITDDYIFDVYRYPSAKLTKQMPYRVGNPFSAKTANLWIAAVSGDR
jgi:signal transduction histidine kinase